jgi:hypothetical protein
MVLVCIVVSWIACMVIAVLYILWSPYVYLLYWLFVVLCICCTVYLLSCVFVVLFIVVLCICCPVYLLYCVLLYCLLCICCTVGIDVFTLDAGLLARGQYSEGPATGHLDKGFSWFPRVFKHMLRWFPRFKDATTCFSCSHPDVNLEASQFHVLCTC